MNKILLFLFLYANIVFGQTLDTIKKIEIYYGIGAQCFPKDGIYAKSEKFTFEKNNDGNFELVTLHKVWHISEQNATVFSKDSSVTNINKKCDSKVLSDLIISLNTDKQNFSYNFLSSKINKPTTHRIKKLAKELDRSYAIECDGLFDCEYRNETIDSIKKFVHFNNFVDKMNLTNHPMLHIGYQNLARITITSQNNVISYNFSFVNNVIGQPIEKTYNQKYILSSISVNLIANEKIRELIPKNTITYDAFDFNKITNEYIRWYLEN
ncbi:hypothetical protein OX283_001655 [Flavobacterium sp. SUN052]|uniref:hypothetical protein n=1 Tax=Flavobacterium sp. SUN052 TaxID=3002441 RepID=UPI00237E98DF|nr:hypothetical protein [Flavobacterium sp. SUN052]MEC4003348.1 hypothetical protein [Flavobacterium sp. SUN052]